MGAAFALVAAPLAFAQQLGRARPLEIPFVQIFAGLILCSLAAFAAALVLRQRRGGGTPMFKMRFPWFTQITPGKRPVKVLETHRLSPHADLCRFAAHDREYIVIVTAGAITIVSERASPADSTSQPATKEPA